LFIRLLKCIYEKSKILTLLIFILEEIMREEYYCTNAEEKEFLIANGFKYTFVKEIMDTKKTTVWKFEKSKKLFITLSNIY